MFIENIMKLILDERERDLYDECYSIQCSQTTPSYVVLSKEVLELGDAIIKTDDDKNILLIERKSFSDLMASIKDGRYEEQSYRLMHSSGYPLHSIVYLIEGLFSQVRTPLEKKTIYSAITSLHYFKGFSTYKTSNIRETAEWLLLTADKIEKSFIKGKIPYYLTQPFLKLYKSTNEDDTSNTEHNNEKEPSSSEYCQVVKKAKKENVRPDNIGEIILCQIPGISSTTAMAIMKNFNHFPHFIEELKTDPKCIDNIQYEKNGKFRKISKSCIENIRLFLLDSEKSAI